MTPSDFSGLPSNSNWGSPKASNNAASKTPVATRNASALEQVNEYFKNEVYTLEALEGITQAHEAFMLRRPKQSYIVRTLISLEYIDTKCVLTPRVTAVDLGSSLSH